MGVLVALLGRALVPSAADLLAQSRSETLLEQARDHSAGRPCARAGRPAGPASLPSLQRRAGRRDVRSHIRRVAFGDPAARAVRLAVRRRDQARRRELDLGAPPRSVRRRGAASLGRRRWGDGGLVLASLSRVPRQPHGRGDGAAVRIAGRCGPDRGLRCVRTASPAALGGGWRVVRLRRCLARLAPRARALRPHRGVAVDPDRRRDRMCELPQATPHHRFCGECGVALRALPKTQAGRPHVRMRDRVVLASFGIGMFVFAGGAGAAMLLGSPPVPERTCFPGLPCGGPPSTVPPSGRRRCLGVRREGPRRIRQRALGGRAARRGRL